jgi:glyoxylase-like metal-dependent hydrolase (beta-lactamase superfamily II)
MKYKKFVVLEGYETNTYLAWDEETGETMLVDPAAPSESLWKFIESHKLLLKYIVITHGHGDHIGGVEFFHNKCNATIAIHEKEADMLRDSQKNLSTLAGMNVTAPEAQWLLKDGDIISLGTQNFQVIHTPGHTKGGICLYGEGILFSGDTLFQEDVGRTDLPGGSSEQLRHSIVDILFSLPEETLVLPGHGPSTTIGDEIVGNLNYGHAARVG